MSISGKLAGGKIGGNVIAGSKGYTFEEVADDLDGTNAGSGGVVQTEAGCVKATARLTAVFDKSTGAYTPIQAGTAVSSLTLHDDITGAAKVTVTAGYVMRSSKRAETRGTIEIDCEISCNAYSVSQ